MKSIIDPNSGCGREALQTATIPCGARRDLALESDTICPSTAFCPPIAVRLVAVALLWSEDRVSTCRLLLFIKNQRLPSQSALNKPVHKQT